MDDDDVSGFCAFTSSTPEVARHFLQITDGDVQQAIQLFFDSPELASAASTSSAPPPVPTFSRPRQPVGREDAEGVVHLDSDDDDDDAMEMDDNAPTASSAAAAAVSNGNQGTYEDDEAMARRLQEEMYAGGGDMGPRGGDYAGDGVRAPIARTTETLLGPGSMYADADPHQEALEMLRRRGHRSRPGVFNQHPASSSIWESAGLNSREALAATTGGESERSSKAARLAELFRPPFELISRMTWDDARDEGKAEQKWILVNIQDPSIFDCQALNRDIWKHQGIKETVKENFIFMQYSKDDPAGQQYMQYYFQHHDDPNAYPHIAIVDPRTGEQVKVWSGPPSPKPMDFMMQLHEFLDRYSLDPAHKNPVARRKAEKPAALDIDRLSEEQALELALQASLGNEAATPPKREDPDDLTKSFAANDPKGKKPAVSEKLIDLDDENTEEFHDAEDEVPSAFASISSDKPHTEPANDPATTTRIQFKHSSGRVVRRFSLSDPVRRIYEWLKVDPIEGKAGMAFELKKAMGGNDLLDDLDKTIGDAGLKNSTVMVEYIEDQAS